MRDGKSSVGILGSLYEVVKENPLSTAGILSGLLLWAGLLIISSGYNGIQGRGCNVNWTRSPYDFAKGVGCTTRAFFEATTNVLGDPSSSGGSAPRRRIRPVGP